MANLAFLRSNLVVCIAPTLADAPSGLVYDTTRDATGANIGDTWNGSAFIRPPVPVEQANEQTLRQQAEAALDANRTAITQMQAWLAANPGNLTAAQLSTAMRANVQQDITAAQQRNGIIRTLLGKFDGTN